MSTKTKKPRAKALPALTTDEQMRTSVDEIAALEVKLRELTAQRDAAMQKVHLEYDGPIDEMETRIKQLTKLCGNYSSANKKSLYGNLKSGLSKLARFGHRDGNPQLLVLNSNWTWAKILERLKEMKRTDFIRTSEEVDKDAIKAAKLDDAQLAQLGMRIDQGQKFFIEPKTEGSDRITEDQAA